jgi:hypothetical protein
MPPFGSAACLYDTQVCPVFVSSARIVSSSTNGTNRCDCREHPAIASNITAARIFTFEAPQASSESPLPVDRENPREGITLWGSRLQEVPRKLKRAACDEHRSAHLQVVPLTANDVGTALVMLFQVPLKPMPL